MKKNLCIKTGPSRCLAETGWREACEGKTGDGSIQLLESRHRGIFLGRWSSEQAVPKGPRQQTWLKDPNLARVWILAVHPFTEDRPALAAPKSPIYPEDRNLASFHTDPKGRP